MADIVRAIRDAQSKSREQSQVVLDNDELLVAWDPPIVFKDRALVQIIVKQNVRAVANKQRIIRVTDDASDNDILRALASSSPVGLPSAAYNAMHREFHPFTCKKCSGVLSKEEYQAHVAACKSNTLQPQSVKKTMSRKRNLDAAIENQKRPADDEEGSKNGQKSRSKQSIKDFMDRLPKRQRITGPVVSGNIQLDQAAPIELPKSLDCKSLSFENSSAGAKRQRGSVQDGAHTRPKKKRAPASKNSKCEAPNCRKRAYYNVDGAQPMRCGDHREPGDINVSNQRCAAPGCKSRSSFAPEGSTLGVRCGKHRNRDDVDVHNKRCAAPGCKLRPSFACEGSTLGVRCKKHRNPDDVDVASKRCAAPGCKSRPSFACEGSTLGVRCGKHRNPDDVNVVSKRCATPGCKSRPSFAPAGSTLRVRCGNHRNPDDVDVKHKRCAEPECTTRARYGRPGHAATHCAPHKLDGQIVNPKRKCESCSGLAMFGVTKAERCENHMLKTDHDFVQHKCVSCGLIELVGEDGKCGACDPKVFLHMRLRKQREIRAMLMQADLPPFETYDQVLDNGVCGKERPDFTWSCGVALEIDESQHKRGNYTAACEMTRMINVTGAMGMPTLWIRFCPDDYVGWRSGMRAKERHEYLVRFLRQQLSEPQHETRVVYLFYDGFTGIPEFKPINLLPSARAAS